MSATKHDNNKEKLSLISSEALKQLSKVMEFGLEKYGRDNWRRGFKWSRLFDACMRHLLAYNSGERKDPETGLSHLAHAMANIAMLIEHETMHLGEDDLFKGYKKLESAPLSEDEIKSLNELEAKDLSNWTAYMDTKSGAV